MPSSARADLEDDVGELTAAAGLLLEDLAVLDGRGERLLVVDLGRTLVDLDAELAAQTVDDDVEVKLAHAADDRLSALLVGTNREGRVLFGQLAQCDAQLVEVFLRLGLDGQTDHRLGEGHLFEHDRRILGAERIARADLLETDGGADVARNDRLDRVLLVGVHLVDTADTLALAAARVEHVGTGIQFSRIDAHERQTAHERVGSDLERQTAERIVLRSVADNLLVGLGVDTRDGRQIQRRRQERDDAVEQFLHALVVERRAAEHRHERHLDRRLADRGDQLFGRDRRRVFEELLHQRVVGSGDLFDELVAPLLGLGLHVVRNLADIEIVADGLVVVVVVRLIIYKVYDSFEFILRTDRQNDRKRRSAEVLLDLAAYGEEIGARAVHLVDVTDTRHVVFVGLTPNGLRLGLHAAHGAEGSHGAVQHAQRTLHLDGEVDVSRSVDQVDLILVILVVPECGRSRRGDRDTAFLLLSHPVHHGRPLVRFADFVSLARVEKDTLRSSGLTGVDVSHDTDIANVV